MECLLSGNEIKALHRAVVCLSRIGNEVVFEAVADKLRLQTFSTAKSAHLTICLKAQFFDVYQLSAPVIGCRVLLKSVCAVFRTPPGSMGRLSITLHDRDATKLQWSVECYNGLRKTFWISCQEELVLQHVAVDRSTLPSNFVVKPRDFNRLLGNFQSSLQELTLFATEPSETPPEAETGTESKAIELRSYTDFVKDTTDGGALHTQLWIDPTEELQSYSHVGAAVDVTFSLKEIKAFLSLCEGCEADMQFNFEKAGRPILLCPKMGLDDGNSDFEATLVLATMMSSQLDTEADDQQPENAVVGSRRASQENGHMNSTPNTARQRRAPSTPGSAQRSGNRSDHTVVWSDLSGSAGRTSTTGRRSGGANTHMTDIGDGTEEVHRAYNVQPPAQIHNPQYSQEHQVREEVGVSAGGRRMTTPAFPDQGPVPQPVSDNVVAAEPWMRQIPDHNGLQTHGDLGRGDMGPEDTENDDDFCVRSTPPDRRYGYD